MAAKASRPTGGTTTRSRVQGGPPAQRPEITIGRGQKGDPAERRARSIRDAILREEWEAKEDGTVSIGHHSTRIEQRVVSRDEGTEVRAARARILSTATGGVNLASALRALVKDAPDTTRQGERITLNAGILDVLVELADAIVQRSGGKL